MSDNPEPLGPAEVIPIVSNLTVDDNTFIVGGQATNLWAWYYRDKVQYLRDEGPFTSQDIDYFGGLDVAQKLAEAINGRVLKPSRDTMNSPNTAIVEVVIDGRYIRIDFLDKLLGISKRDIERGASVLAIGADVGGTPVIVEVPIMHPLLCLKSRIANIMHPATKRRDATAMRQLQASYHVSEAYIDHALRDGDHREATDFLLGTFNYLRSDQFGRHAHNEVPIDPLGIMNRFISDERIDPRYRERALARQIEIIKEARVGRNDRQAQLLRPN